MLCELHAIDVISKREEEELAKLAERLDKAYGMEIRPRRPS